MASNPSTTFHKPHVLVVEGKDDFWVCVALLKALAIESVQVIDTGGFENLAPQLKLFTKTPGWASVRRVAVMVDCDGDAVARATSVKGSLKKAGLAEPAEPGVFAGQEPAVAYCLVPSGGGCLEDLICAALADGDIRATCVDSFIACSGLQDDVSSKRPKAWVHAYIAVTQPGLKVGEAANAGILKLESKPYELIRSLILALQTNPESQAA